MMGGWGWVLGERGPSAAAGGRRWAPFAGHDHFLPGGLFMEEILLLPDPRHPKRYDRPGGERGDGSGLEADFERAPDEPLAGAPDDRPHGGEGERLLQQPQEEHR